jgi:hypothetical protein
MHDNRYSPVAHADLKAALESVVADNWQAKELAQCLLNEMSELHGEDRGHWLLSKLDEFDLLLSALRIRFFGHPPLFAKFGLKITIGANTKRLQRDSE